MKPLILIGAGGHGRVVADIASSIGRSDIAFLDNNWRELRTSGAWPVVGPARAWTEYQSNSDFFVSIGNSEARYEIAKQIEAESGRDLCSLIHPSAQVSTHAKVGPGAVVMAGAVIEAFAEIGRYCIINTAASINHDCRLAEAVHVSPGCHIAGGVRIGTRSWIGIGSAVRQGAIIGDDCMIGAGATVIKDIPDGATALGTPACPVGQ